jgi:hypothetical protein
MGQKLMAWYDFVESVAGREGKTKLAKLTCIPSVLAMGKPDDPAILEKFRVAIRQITGRDPPP